MQKHFPTTRDKTDIYMCYGDIEGTLKNEKLRKRKIKEGSERARGEQSSRQRQGKVRQDEEGKKKTEATIW